MPRLRRSSLNSCIFNRVGSRTRSPYISQHAAVWSCSLFCCSHGNPYTRRNLHITALQSTTINIQHPKTPQQSLRTYAACPKDSTSTAVDFHTIDHSFSPIHPCRSSSWPMAATIGTHIELPTSRYCSARGTTQRKPSGKPIMR